MGRTCLGGSAVLDSSGQAPENRPNACVKTQEDLRTEGTGLTVVILTIGARAIIGTTAASAAITVLLMYRTDVAIAAVET